MFKKSFHLHYETIDAYTIMKKIHSTISAEQFSLKHVEYSFFLSTKSTFNYTAVWWNETFLIKTSFIPQFYLKQFKKSEAQPLNN